jgi:prepilin-type N-terminal cleavage/methylation domain-containing protein
MLTIRPTLTRQRFSKRQWRRISGFSLLELTTALAVGVILAAMAVPAVSSSVQYFRVRAAVSSVTGAIQSTRYRAIFDGCPYNITFSSTANTFQVASETAVAGSSCATSFSNVGGAVPFGSTAVALNQNLTLQFKPSGYVQATTGATTFTLTYGSTSKTVTVSNYGNINVTP